MTRINAFIKPAELCDQMLLAEHREIKRIPNVISKSKKKLNDYDIPDDFRLGAGHVLFFYNKVEYLHERYIEIRIECRKRGFEVTDYSKAFYSVKKKFYKQWNPTQKEKDKAREKLKLRINLRLSRMTGKIRYYGKTVEYLDMIIK